MAKGFGGGMNMNMIKQAQRMQQNMLKMQEELENKEFSASVGGGVVSATVNGKGALLSVTISPDAVDPDDVEMLQDLIVAAVNEASRAAEEASAAEMKKLTGGLGIPGMFLYDGEDVQFFTAPVEHLIEQFQKLPGIGRKTAQRLAFFVLSLSEEDANTFAAAVVDAKKSV